MVFRHKDYKAYLNERLDDPSYGTRGARAKLSRAIGCQTAYTSHVLKNTGHFSLEQAEGINEFFAHTEFEGEYFLLLVQFARAGSKALKQRVERQLARLREEHHLLKNRLTVKDKLSEMDQSQYYSSWRYGAIHALVSIPGFQTIDKLAARLELSTTSVERAVEFLLSCGLLAKEKGRLKIGRSSIHLGVDSELIWKHHANWRLKTLQSLEKNSKESLHYSSVITLSENDAEIIREAIIKVIKEAKAILPNSPEEKLMSFNIDFFDL